MRARRRHPRGSTSRRRPRPPHTPPTHPVVGRPGGAAQVPQELSGVHRRLPSPSDDRTRAPTGGSGTFHIHPEPARRSGASPIGSGTPRADAAAMSDHAARPHRSPQPPRAAGPRKLVRLRPTTATSPASCAGRGRILQRGPHHRPDRRAGPAPHRHPASSPASRPGSSCPPPTAPIARRQASRRSPRTRRPRSSASALIALALSRALRRLGGRPAREWLWPAGPHGGAGAWLLLRRRGRRRPRPPGPAPPGRAIAAVTAADP